MADFPILNAPIGLNNKVDPRRLPADYKSGTADLGVAVNCDIDDGLMISNRKGRELISTDPYLNNYCNNGDCFVVADRDTDAAIFRLGTDFVVEPLPIVSGLVKGDRVGFWQEGDMTYWSNFTANGIIVDGINYPWHGYSHVGDTTQKVFSPAPFGNKIAIFKGRMLVGLGKNIYFSEIFAYGKFRLLEGYFPRPSDIKMIVPVEFGLWVSDSTETGFVAYEGSYASMKYDMRAECPAHEFSENDSLTDYRKSALGIPGMCATWSSDEGLCVGTPQGELIVTTKDKLYYPTGGNGATVVEGHNVINSIW